MWGKQWENSKMLLGELQEFWVYLKKHKFLAIMFSALLLLVYSSWLGKLGLRIDSEFMVNHPRTYYNYLVIGRPGLALTQWIFGYKWFNASHYVLFAYLMLCVSGVLFGYLCYRCSKKDVICYPAFGLLMFTCPLFVEQFYFTNQIFGIAWAYTLCACAVGFSYCAAYKKNLLAAVLAIIGMVWSFSTYQVYIITYIAMVLVCFLLLYSRWEVDAERTAKINLWRLAWVIVLQFVIGIAVYWFIVSKWFMAGGYYISNQIAWKNQSIEQGLNTICQHIKMAALGQGTFYTVFYGIFSVLSVLCVAVELICSKERRYKWMYALAVIVLQLSPFFMTIFMGTVPTERAQLVYPFVLTADAIFVLSRVYNYQFLRAIVMLGILLMFWNQSGMTMRLLYTDEVREQEDIRLAEQIEMRLQEVDPNREKEVAFIGVYECELNPICVKGNLIGNSVFNWDSGANPKYLHSTARIWGTLHTLGYSFQYVWTEEQMIKARTEALAMPCWPAEGSVEDKGEFIVVKLSKDIWQGELAK